MKAHALILGVWLIVSLQVSNANPEASGCVRDRYGNIVCGPPGSQCRKAIHGEVKCSPPDGGIMLDRYKEPVCGPGRCIADRYGEVLCSIVPKGAAAVDVHGDVVCTQACTKASPRACVTPER
jgi:hypothetical protein